MNKGGNQPSLVRRQNSCHDNMGDPRLHELAALHGKAVTRVETPGVGLRVEAHCPMP